MPSPSGLSQALTTGFPTSGKIMEVPGVGFMLAWGTTVPTDATTGYAPGCIFIHTDGSGYADVLYGNQGTKASCNFDAILAGTS